MLQPGESIDIWVVEKALGSGGMGSVYRCHNRSATRILAAVKVLDSSLRKIAGAEERFIREAEILFRLDHPNIVKVRNIRTDTDPPYLEMEFVEGESLENVLERGVVPLDRSLDIGIQLCDAVCYLHEQGIRHRDIKPANVLIKSDGKLKLVDFGLAVETDVTRITQAGTTFGTVSYAPPEWVTPDSLDPVRWDIYAMGVVLWEMLSGGVAFPVSGQGSARQQAMQVMLQKQNHPPLDPGEQFQEPLRQLVRDMTESNADRRPESAAFVLERLRRLERTYARPTGKTIVATITDGGRETSDTWVDQGGTPGPSTLDGPRLRPPGPVAEAALAAGGALATAPADGLALSADPAATTLDPAADPTPSLRPRDTSDGTLVGRAPTTPTASLPGDDKPRSPLPLLVGGVVALGLACVAVLGAGALAWHWASGATAPSARDVDVVVGGLPSGTDVGVTLGGRPPSSKDGWVYHFRDVALGDEDLWWTVGPGCETSCSPGAACPSWCGTSTTPERIVPGDGVAVVPLSLEPPAARAVTIAAPKAGAPLSFTIDGKAGTTVDAHSGQIDLTPGKYTVVATAGSASWTGDVEVPWGTGDHHVAIPLEGPAAQADVPKDPGATSKAKDVPKDPKVEKPEKPVEKASTEAPAGKVGRLVTNGDFARWLAGNPDWAPTAAVAAGRADAAYLAGWTDGKPPAGSEKQAVTNVSWYAASAYCASRGGLAGVDADPQTWTTQPDIEWRTEGGKAAWRMSDGTKSTAVQKSQGNVATGFRCAK